MYWLVVSAIWGTIKLFQTRAAVDMVDEDSWAFGQIIPLVLLIAPLFAIVEQLYSGMFPHIICFLFSYCVCLLPIVVIF